MRLGRLWSVLTVLAIFAFTVLAGSVVFADDSSNQKNKNNWRNIGAGAGAIALHGLINGNNTETLIGAAGAAYSANKYEQARKSQSADNDSRTRYHHSSSYYQNNRKYYWFQGHQYYMDPSTRNRVRVN